MPRAASKATRSPLLRMRSLTSQLFTRFCTKAKRFVMVCADIEDTYVVAKWVPSPLDQFPAAVVQVSLPARKSGGLRQLLFATLFTGRAGPMLCQRCKPASQQIPANFQHLLETPTDLPHASGVAAATQAADHLTAWTFSLGMPRSPGGTLCMITLNKTNSVSQNLVICVARGTLVLAFAHLLSQGTATRITA